MKKNLVVLAGLLAFLAAWFIPNQEAQATSAWARRYNADCSMCHTMYPRLNPAGQKFRRLGYRMPDEFDQGDSKVSMEELSKTTNYLAARGRPRVALNKTKGAATDFRFQMDDVTLFYAGPVSRNASFFFELPFEPSEGHAFLEVGQVLLNFGKSDSFFFLRTGQFHQLSGVGYGGLDRPIGLSRSSLVGTTINGFRPRQDGIGFETGYSVDTFTGLIQVTNGITATGGSALDNNDPNKAKDFKALLEYMIPNHDGSVSLAYVSGKGPTPQNNAGAVVAGAENTKYNRVYLFADYTFDSIGLKPIVGGSVGYDNQFVSGIGSAAAALVTADTSRSILGFAELDQKISKSVYGVGRFDMFDATNKAGGTNATSRTWSGSGALVWSFQDYLRTTAEYQLTDNKAGNAAHSLTGELQLVF